MRAIALLSGGLDSALAIKLVRNQGVDVMALNFTSPFCTCSPKAGGCHMATAVAQELGVELRMMSKGLEYLKIVEKPKHGHGRGMNPCIDCRIFMLRKAAKLMAEEGFSFVITGEVLGQRPMSQHRQAIDLIERESGLPGLILRPLSAQHFAPTIPEANGWVDRSKLLAIEGRSRKVQYEVAAREGVEKFGCPAGGCLLTDENIARRVRDMFEYVADYTMHDASLLRVGRHLRLHKGLKVIIGRDADECRRLEAAGPSYGRLEIVDFPGPVLLTRGEPADADFPRLGALLRFFAKKAVGDAVTVAWTQGETTKTFSVADIAAMAEVDAMRI